MDFYCPNNVMSIGVSFQTAIVLATALCVLSGCVRDSEGKTRGGGGVPAALASEHSPGQVWPLNGDLKLVASGDLGSGSNRVDYLLETDDGKIITKLPDFYGNGYWSYWNTRGVAYEDLDGDGRKDIAILARYVTGIGPNGAEPFDVVGFYFNTDKGFERADNLDELANSERYARQRDSVSGVVTLARELCSKRGGCVQGQP